MLPSRRRTIDTPAPWTTPVWRSPSPLPQMRRPAYPVAARAPGTPDNRVSWNCAGRPAPGGRGLLHAPPDPCALTAGVRRAVAERSSGYHEDSLAAMFGQLVAWGRALKPLRAARPEHDPAQHDESREERP